MTDTTESRPPDAAAEQAARTFFEDYGAALLARDVAAISDQYGVPALIEFPGTAIAVTDRTQTEQFFEQALGQYAQVVTATPRVTVVASTPDSIWADVAWDYGDAAPAERNMYQLARRDGEWRIAVLTPLAP